MTQDEIIEMARQAGLFKDYGDGQGSWLANDKNLEDFAKLVAAKEREAIYDIVMMAPFKDLEQDEFDGEIGTYMKSMAWSITSSIRARGEA